MKSVLIAVGHWNIENITQEGLRSWRSSSVLKRSTGASGERNYHWNEIMPRLRDKLIDADVQVYITDATYNADIYNRNYDLCVFLHYDGGGSGERCMISAPNRATQPQYLNPDAFTEAERFAQIWKTTYPEIVGVPNRDDKITIGMRDYYAFDYVGFDTPSVIIEHFNHSSHRGSFLKNNPELVAEADYQSIKKYLGIEDIITDDKYRVVHKGEVIATYDYNPEDKMREYAEQNAILQEQLADKTNEVADLTVALQNQEADNARLTTDLRTCHLERDKLIVDKKILEAQLADSNRRLQIALEKIEALESLKPCDAYGGWQMIVMGVNKLLGKGQ